MMIQYGVILVIVTDDPKRILFPLSKVKSSYGVRSNTIFLDLNKLYREGWTISDLQKQGEGFKYVTTGWGLH